MADEKGTTRPETVESSPQPLQTVWQHDDAVRQWGEEPSAAHWSRQTTEPQGPRWIPQRRQRLDARQAAAARARESRAVGWGAGLGALLMVVVLGLVALVAALNGWLPGSSSPSPDGTQLPIPASSTTVHTPIPGATTIPTAPPKATTQPTATTAPTATTQPTATAQPTATSAPTATPLPLPIP